VDPQDQNRTRIAPACPEIGFCWLADPSFDGFQLKSPAEISMQIRTGDAARSELLISEPKTRVRPQAAASAHRAHPVSSSRDQQPQTGSGPRPEVLDYRKSTVWDFPIEAFRYLKSC
jgi:hypothetical protein